MKKNLLLLISFFIVTISGHAQWAALGNGFDGDVNAVCVYNNALYAAGNFTHDGTLATSFAHIAKWDGTSWTAVGTGLGGNASALVVFGGELYVGGDFLTAGGSAANRIAKWNGTSWSAVGSGFNNTVRCLYTWNSTLYAGGTFTGSGATLIGRIAKLSGASTWLQVGGGAAGPVNAIADFNSELFIGGNWFPPYVAKFNGTTWDDLTGTGPDNEVTSLAAFRKQSSTNIVLWIGGRFSTPSPRLCSWTAGNGFATSFNNFNSTPGDVNALLATPGYLYAGGGFSATVGPTNISKLGKYSGTTTWDTAGVSLNNDVNAMTTFNGFLVVGGKFTSMGTAGAANRIASRFLSIGIDEIDNNVLSAEFFPNPLIETSTLKLLTKSAVHQPVLKIFDLDGREINPFTEPVPFSRSGNEIEYRIERSGLPSGIYFYLLSDSEHDLAAGKFVVE